jgi:glucose 1-dehydrogenase
MARHGYASERYRIRPEYLVAVDPELGPQGVLLEPATVVAKAWDHVGKIGNRSTWAPSTVLVTGAGPIGLLAALLSVRMLLEASKHLVRHRIVCLTGVSAAGSESMVDPGLLNRNMVLNNNVIFGSVNANRRHYELGAEALAQADKGWLAGLITRQVPLDSWADAYTRQPDDIKTVLTFPL